ncbi:MAG: hypothetical protein ACLPXB_12190 [Thiobacillaceae bacterium]
MQTTIIISALLLSLELLLASPAWSSTVVEPPLPPEVQDMPAAPIEPSEKTVIPVTSSRGQLLYENHCTSCHESTVHVRDDRRVQSLTELRERVARWATYLNLHWSEMEVDDVVHYLNNRFYKF